jgi:hypothetical protein
MLFVSRRSALWFLAVIASGAGLNAFLERQGGPPTEEWARERLWGDDLLAYAVRDGVPRAVVRFHNRVQYDLMIPGDWFWPNWPPAPQWQLAGIGYSIAYSIMPATVGFACLGVYGEECGRSIEIFGQINDGAIVAMEVLVGDTWRRYEVAVPGFAVRLDGVTTVPSGYRWLNAQGRIVHEIEGASPTKPGPPDPFRRRRRRRATPAAGTSQEESDSRSSIPED